jgi:hypothetical protein
MAKKLNETMISRVLPHVGRDENWDNGIEIQKMTKQKNNISGKQKATMQNPCLKSNMNKKKTFETPMEAGKPSKKPQPKPGKKVTPRAAQARGAKRNKMKTRRKKKKSWTKQTWGHGRNAPNLFCSPSLEPSRTRLATILMGSTKNLEGTHRVDCLTDGTLEAEEDLPCNLATSNQVLVESAAWAGKVPLQSWGTGPVTNDSEMHFWVKTTSIVWKLRATLRQAIAFHLLGINSAFFGTEQSPRKRMEGGQNPTCD